MSDSRRNFLGAAAGLAVTLPTLALAGEKKSKTKTTDTTTTTTPVTPATTPPETPTATPAPTGPIELPPLPYAEDALAPTISAETVSFHYGKHHKTYVEKTNELIKGTDFEKQSLSEIVKGSFGTDRNSPNGAALFNNAAQVWNHTFYWRGLKPGGGGAPTGKVLEAINASFGSYDAFRKEFTTAATGQFGSGWAWLVENKGKLLVMKTANAETPITTADHRPIFVVDVWEHAYYVDYRNKRLDYVNGILDKLVNWDFVNEKLANSGNSSGG